MKAKNLLILAIAIMAVALSANAQTPTALAKLFDGPYQNNKAATELIITGSPLKPYSLSSFHSLGVKDDPALALPLEQAVKSDGAKALWKETVSKGGRLESGVYELPSENLIRRRYILYLNGFIGGRNEAIVIYLEGRSTPEKIKKLIKEMTE